MAIRSVLLQEHSDLELIVVDGVSTDGTVDVIREWEPKFCGRMKWISEPDHGIYDAMNKGTAAASGENPARRRRQGERRIRRDSGEGESRRDRDRQGRQRRGG